MRTIARHLMRVTASAALVASLGPQASAQTEPTLTVSPSLSSVVLSGSVTVTVLACAYEAGDNMINLATIQIRTWNYATSASYVDVTGDFTMENADPAECNFFGNQSDEVFVKWVGTVSVTPTTGPVILNAHIYSLRDYFYQSIKTYFPPAARRSVAVVSEQGFVEALPSASRSERFTVTNTGNDTATFALTASGCSSGAISASCTIAPSSTISALAVGASSTVTVSYTASGSNGSTGLLRLLAVRSAETTIRDSAWTDITVTAAPSVGAHLFGHAPGAGDYLLRNACVTVALTPQAASECGDLRIVHALVSARTMGRTRAPVLLYNSAHARPIPVVQADIRLRSDLGLPSDGTTSIVRTDTSAACGSRSTAGTAWGAAGNVQRVVVPFSGCPVATGMYRYRVQFTSSNQSHTSADTGRLYIVNHSASRFGAGWWLAGLERLRIRSSTELLWIGGDGSVRRYVKSGSVWKVPTAFALPDSITQSGNTYIRHTAEHARVFYDSSGRHDSTRTIDRHVTRFLYAGATDSLIAMRMPLADTLAGLDTLMQYSFAYPDDSTVRITAPGNRVTTLRRPGGRLTRIIDPDGDTTRFEYSSSPYANEINAINDRAGARTTFAFDSARRVITATRPLGNVLAIEPSESKGWIPVPLDSVFTQVDGPRSDVADKSRMWVNRHGSVVRLRDALGRETKITNSTAWAGLPERVISPTRLSTVASYNSRGLVDSVATLAPYGGASGSASGNALTEYEWHSTLNRVERIRARSGAGADITKFDTLAVASYNSDSSLAWQQRGGSSTTRVTFAYTTTASGARLPLSITQPDSGVTTFFYDQRGNLRKTVSPLGFVSLSVNDNVGRPVRLYTPRDTGSRGADSSLVVQYGVVDSIWYDTLGRDSAQVTRGPVDTLANGRIIFADWVRVSKVYDPMGRVRQHRRRFSVNGATVGASDTLVATWQYDSLGRATLASEPGGGANYSTYDASGNVIEATTPRGFVIAMQYDALNRLTRRVTPSVSEGNALCYWYGTLCTYTFPILDDASTRCIGVDTALFAYDVSGQTRVADNNWARIRRSYAPNGALLSETQIIRKYATEAPNACGGGDRHAGAFSETGSDWNAHSYQLQYGYDHLGRRISLTLPTQLDPCSGACMQQYAYSSRGELATLTHPSASGGTLQTTYTYDATGQLTSTTAPGSVVLNLAYDREGRVLRRVGSGGHPAADTLRYDAGGRVIRVSSGGTPVALEYAGLGALASVTGLASGLSSEAFLVDGIGTLRFTHDVDMVAGINRTRRHTFSGLRLTGGVLADTGSNCATSLVRSCHPSWYVWSLALEHDASGNVTSTAERDTRGTSLSDASTVLRNARSYFGADERLMSHEDAEGVNGVAGTSSEYRYDALGRRVLVRVRKIEPTCSSPCDAYIERTVYDGDQVLAEIRSSGQAYATAAVLEGEGIAAQDGTTSGWTDPTYPLLFGVVLYAHGLGVDAPAHLAKLRPDSGWTTLTPQAGWRGDIAFGNLADGTNCTTFTPWRCPTEWLAATVSAYRRDVGADPVPFSNWFGSLVRGRRDASGLTFLRNRYYNPTTGQFTQLDPFGLAGGLNSYGFAGGDPVNYSDPFGLCPPADDNFSDCAAGSAAWYANRVVTGEGNRALNEVGGALATCGESLSCNAVLMFGGAVGNATARVGNALWKAATGIGDDAVMMGSATEAGVAGRLWTASRGERPILASRGSGSAIGRSSGDGSRVYRAPQMKNSGPNSGSRAANLVRKDAAGKELANTHLVIP